MVFFKMAHCKCKMPTIIAKSFHVVTNAPCMAFIECQHLCFKEDHLVRKNEQRTENGTEQIL